jgi:hypothetical protein
MFRGEVREFQLRKIIKTRAAFQTTKLAPSCFG